MKLLYLLPRYLFGNILYLLSYLVPKSNRIWVFGSWAGELFADSPKYLFQYVSNSEFEFFPVWLTRNKKLANDLRRQGLNCYRINSLLGLWYSLRAKVAVISHGMIDVHRHACARQEIVQTWHGIPMKPVLLSDPKIKAIRKRKRKALLSFFFPFIKKDIEFNNYLAICSTSPHITDLFRKVFGASAPLVETGFPKNDALVKNSYESELGRKIESQIEQGYKVGLYIPTYRLEHEFDIVAYLQANLELIEKWLVEERMYLYLRFHPFDQRRLSDSLKSSHVFLVRDEDINNDVTNILGLFDLLITDYSSLAFDFLMIEKPIFFLAPDREEYIESNGEFVYDYQEMNLPISKDWKSVLEKIAKDEYRNSSLEELSAKYHSYKDGKNSERLFKLISDKIST